MRALLGSKRLKINNNKIKAFLFKRLKKPQSHMKVWTRMKSGMEGFKATLIQGNQGNVDSNFKRRNKQ